MALAAKFYKVKLSAIIIPAFFAKVKQFRVYRSVILQILFEKGKERAFSRGSVWVIKKAQA